MKVWQGLLMKERLLMRGWFYATIAFMTLLTFVLPVFLTLYFKFSSNEIKKVLPQSQYFGFYSSYLFQQLF